MEKIKVAVSTIFAFLTAKLGILALPVYILMFLNIADYCTGIAASYYKGEKVCSKKGFRGIAKKICMWLLVAVGVIIDKMLVYTATVAGITLSLDFLVGCFAAIWLISNEVLSLLENISEIGVNVPEFLKTAATKIKDKINEKRM